ncbi:MAG TPA: hypothetical protein VFF11_04705, partial [Candidatus Binatia bacterium]|nr:hypothetical protein [Candidatus Binatia bacterium]
AALTIPDFALATPNAEPVSAPGVYVVVSVKLKDEKWMGVHGAFFQEQEAIQEATRLAGEAGPKTTYNYIVVPTTLK